MKKFNRVLVAGTATTMLLGSVLNVSAAGLRDIFDAKYYADSYADLKASFGYDENKLYNHFMTYGLKEGRNMSPILDVVAYRAAYGDLNAAFGDNWDAYVNHFLTFGASEMRDKGVLFNPVLYAEAYGDIRAAYGGDLMAIARHYLTYGQAENRTLGTSNGYADISTAREAARQAAQQAAQQSEGLGKPSVTWNSWGGRTEYEYDGRGNIIMAVRYGDTGEMTWSDRYTYNDNDDVVYHESKDGEGNLETYTRYEYDGKKLKSWTDYTGDGEVSAYSTYEWDGSKVKISHFDASDNLTGYTECETDSHYNFTKGTHYTSEGTRTGSYVQTFDGDDNVLTYVAYDADGNELSSQTYTYYENGVMKTETYTHTDTSMGDSRRRKNVSEYNESGSQISYRSYTDDKLTYENTYEYSAEGPVAKRLGVSYDDDGRISYKGTTEYAADRSYTVSSESYNSDGILRGRTSEVYNAQRELMKRISYNFNNDGGVSYKSVTEYAADRSYTESSESYNSDGTLSSKYIGVYNAQREQVKWISYSITAGEVSAVSVYEYENGRIVKESDYRADGETLIGAVTYTYEEKDYGYDRIYEYVYADGSVRDTGINMYDANGIYLGWRSHWSDGTTEEYWYNQRCRMLYDADGKLYRMEIKDDSWTTVAAYEYDYDADGNPIEFELVKDENGNWVRPSENPGTDEPGTDVPGTDVSGGDADPGSVSGNGTADN